MRHKFWWSDYEWADRESAGKARLKGLLCIWRKQEIRGWQVQWDYLEVISLAEAGFGAKQLCG
jgi:hypothetical protein